jgi:hypothetical protein
MTINKTEFNKILARSGRKKQAKDKPGNTKGGSITVPLTSCLTGLDQSVLKTKTKIVSSHTPDSKPGIQEVNGTTVLPL